LTTQVQDQKNCGSCWAFGTSAVAEATYNIDMKSTTPAKFSEQQLVDCDSGTGGCRGGWPRYAMDYFINKSGATALSNYPYLGRDGTCKTSSIVDPTDLFDHRFFISPNNDDLKEATASAPVSIVFHVNRAFMSYASGVFSDTSCVTQSMGLHAVVQTGYDMTEGNMYWRLRNSWGARWGEQGHFRMAVVAGSNGICKMHMSTYGLKYAAE
jgi:C1A family cysteine protease